MVRTFKHLRDSRTGKPLRIGVRGKIHYKTIVGRPTTSKKIREQARSSSARLTKAFLPRAWSFAPLHAKPRFV